MPVAAIYGTKHYAVQADHLNTPRRLIQSDGQVAWQWAYSAFGDEQPTIAKNRFANTALNQSFGSTTVPAVTFNLRYPGQYFDQESNLHYNYHRSYSATVGRYTQADPIGLDGGWNRFGYAEQNPLSFVDPTGEVVQACALNPAGCVAVVRICVTAVKAIAAAIGAGYLVKTFDCTNDNSCPDDDCKDKCVKKYELDATECQVAYSFWGGKGYQACMTRAGERLGECTKRCDGK